MKEKDLQEVIHCLPEGRTIYCYFKDRYALDLLHYVAPKNSKIRDLKKSALAPLLQKAVVKSALANAGGGRLENTAFNSVGSSDAEPFVLTVGKWGGSRCEQWWHQTSRAGYNLVLQLNLSEQHSEVLRRAGQPIGDFMNNLYHPVLHRRSNGFYRDTLAWARIDLDFANDEALIEEVQSDWSWGSRDEDSNVRRVGTQWLTADGKPLDLWDYMDQVVAIYRGLWDEAMLSAAITFITQELGIRTIFYHDFNTGNALKGLRQGVLPPKSLYRQLPRRFCFQHAARAPAFLLADTYSRRVLKKLGASARFFHHVLER